MTAVVAPILEELALADAVSSDKARNMAVTEALAPPLGVSSASAVAIGNEAALACVLNTTKLRAVVLEFVALTAWTDVVSNVRALALVIAATFPWAVGESFAAAVVAALAAAFTLLDAVSDTGTRIPGVEVTLLVTLGDNSALAVSGELADPADTTEGAINARAVVAAVAAPFD